VAVGDMSNIGGGFAGVIGGLASVGGHTDADGKLINSAYLVGAAGNLGGNHPVSIPYAGETGYNSIDSSVPASEVGPSVLGGYYSVVTGASCLSPTGICTSAPASDGRNGAAVNLVPNAPGAPPRRRRVFLLPRAAQQVRLPGVRPRGHRERQRPLPLLPQQVMEPP
jgi:hypothetical protein